MNSDANQKHREQLEVRLVAMLLGEASAFETDELQRLMANDPALQAFHDQMESTIGLAQAAGKQSAAHAQSATTQPKLSAKRREVLLKMLQQPKEKVLPFPETPKQKTAETRQPRRGKMDWVIWTAAAAACVMVLAGMLLPALSKAKSRSQRISLAHAQKQAKLEAEMQASSAPADVANLKPIDGDKGPWPLKQQNSLPASGAPEVAATPKGAEWYSRRGSRSVAAASPVSEPAPVFLPKAAANESEALADNYFASTGGAAMVAAEIQADPARPAEPNNTLHFDQATSAGNRIPASAPARSMTTRADDPRLAQAGAAEAVRREGKDLYFFSEKLSTSAPAPASPEWSGVQKQPEPARPNDNRFVGRYVGAFAADEKVRQEAEGKAVELAKSKEESNFRRFASGKSNVAEKAAPRKAAAIEHDAPIKKTATPPATPQPEILTRENAFSTFSLNVSDVSFKLAAASLQNNTIPEAGSIRVEEFINAFNYRDPAPAPGARLAFAWERARYPFAHHRDVVRFSVQTAARGRDAQKPLNLVILLDNSGSMERADRVAIVHEALRVLAQQLRPQDRISVIGFSRTARLWIDGMAGGDPQAFLSKVLDLNPEGGTNLEEAMALGYATAKRHFILEGSNRVILFTDGAANLGNVEPEELKKRVVAERQKGIALDCFGIGWDGYNDDLLETLSRNGDGRYGFLNRPEQAAPEFANQLAGTLNVAASDVKTQVEFNPNRVTSWRQIGYAKHQLTKEQFRDNTVDAAEIAAAEQGNALYVIETKPDGFGPLGVVRVRFKVPDTGEYLEQEWPLEYQPRPLALDQASAAMRLAVTASAFGEWLSTSPFAAEVTLPALQNLLSGVPETFSPDPRPAQLAEMLRQSRTITGQ